MKPPWEIILWFLCKFKISVANAGLFTILYFGILSIVILSIVSITNATTVRKSHAMLRAFADVKTGVKPQQATSNKSKH